MFSPELQGQLAKERVARAFAPARIQRQPSRPVPAISSAASIRQAVGRRFIAIGDRLVAEPSLRSVRSR
jgi:hypothetical protein